MNRFQKKMLLASAGLHGFLVLLLLFGSAFFVSKDKPIAQQRLNEVPTDIIEKALAGGGGNPDLVRTDDRKKGETLLPQPAAAPAQPVAPPAKPTKPQPPEPKPEVRKIEPKKLDLPTPAPKPVKPTEVVKLKSVDKTPEAKTRIDLNELQPIARTETDKRKAQKEAEAREAAFEAARHEAAANAARQKLAQQIGKAADTMRRGFAGGTKVEVSGPGGDAYANYGSLVQAAYEDAWQIIQDLSDDDSIAIVRVTIARDGRVLSARFVDRSKSASMNRSVQRALDTVKKLPPFPDFIKEAERSFTIEFNLKAKRLLG